MAGNSENKIVPAEMKDSFMRFASSAFRTSKVAFSRARQVTGERFGNAEKTELDAQFEHLTVRADRIKSWTEKIAQHVEAMLKPNPGARLEDYMFEKLDKKTPIRPTNAFVLGQTMTYAGRELGAGTEYGSALGKTGTSLKKVGNAEKDFMQKTMSQFLHPLQSFLDNDMKTVMKERRSLETARIDLDAARNKAEGEFRVAQADFDRQYEITKLLLDSICSSQSNHLRSLNSFVEAIGMYHAQCQQYIMDLQKDLQSQINSPSASKPDLPAVPKTSKSMDAKMSVSRKAKVLYDYDASDDTELSLLADEIVIVHNVEGMDADWMLAERGSQKGKVPLTYLELL